jgi:uncharacterized protein YdeI (YjbR/CyaY-like superfamily)
MSKSKGASVEYPTILFNSPEEWLSWLEANHASAPGVWMRFAKKGADFSSISYLQAVEGALCYGWIDGQSKSLDESSWLQKFTPRTRKSIWSKINRGRATALIESGAMQPAGLAAVEAAQKDGRWEAAYDPPSTATVPDDLQAALDGNPKAAAFFATLNSRNRFGILHRLHQAKRLETRAKRIADFVAMLEREEKLYP